MSKKVLVVDDHRDIRKMMKMLLEMYGYDVVEAGNGYEAVERAINDKPDLIFMDIGMPLLDGVEATVAIRAHAELADIPILALSGYADFYRDRAEAAGCTEVIRKPLDFNRLRPLVRHYIR
jgi:CheY-like chemotaxis protein